MASANKITLVGNVGADPALRQSASGVASCNIRLATTASFRGKTTGERREVTEWTARNDVSTPGREHRSVTQQRFAGLQEVMTHP